MKSTQEWGRFFPIEMCDYGYNETVAMDHFPLSEQEALQKGYHWSTYQSPPPVVKQTVSSDSLPDSIDEITDEILENAILCEVTDKPFKPSIKELEFYRKLRIPFPRRSPDQRHADRMKKRPEFRLETTQCTSCNKQIYSNISPIGSSIVLCDDCFKKEVY
jgi:hypothetical protein